MDNTTIESVTNVNSDLLLKVEAALQSMRPFLEADGGNVELVKVVDTTVWLRMVGTCKTCSMRSMTMKAGIEDGIRRSVPYITRVRAIDDADVLPSDLV
ncbi:MAG: NifU family protein [Bacteroidota bacterium]|nr:NifU family protein [Bacteroidota bacterium]